MREKVGSLILSLPLLSDCYEEREQNRKKRAESIIASFFKSKNKKGSCKNLTSYADYNYLFCKVLGKG